MIGLVVATAMLAQPPSDRLNYDPQVALRRQIAEQIETQRVENARGCVHAQVAVALMGGAQSRRRIAEHVADTCVRMFSETVSLGGKVARPAALAQAYDEIARQAPAGQRP